MCVREVNFVCVCYRESIPCVLQTKVMFVHMCYMIEKKCVHVFYRIEKKFVHVSYRTEEEFACVQYRTEGEFVHILLDKNMYVKFLFQPDLLSSITKNLINSKK